MIRIAQTLFLFVLVENHVSVLSIVRFGKPSEIGHSPRKNERALNSQVLEVTRSKDFLLPKERPASSIGETVEFELFDGDVLLGTVNEIFDRGQDGPMTWSGTLVHADDSANTTSVHDVFTLTCYLDACTANIVVETTKAHYIIEPSIETSLSTEGGVGYRIAELGEKKLSGTSRNPHISSHASHSSPEPASNHLRTGKKYSESNMQAMATAANVDTDQIVDIGVLYTPQALGVLGGSVPAMIARVYMATDEANQILARSAISLRYRVVFCLGLTNQSFVEPGTDAAAFGQLLSWLRTPGDGYLDDAQVYREAYQADFVLLVNKASAYAGLGYVNSRGAAPNYAFANYNVNYVYGQVWAHEMGHIMGCYHDRFSSALDSRAAFYGYGNCWEDTSKNDCTCYSSVMVYDCRTVPNNCTQCSGRGYYSNYKVKNAGSPTGLPLASCGAYIDDNRYTPIAYRKSIQTGGMIMSVSPNFAMISSCSFLNISGWMIGFGGNITSVTLAGVSAKIRLQNVNWVVVESPLVNAPTVGPGDVVVSTLAGRKSVLTRGFSFRAMEGFVPSNFANGLAGTPWEATTSAPWTTGFQGGVYVANKGTGALDGAVEELTATRLQKLSIQSQCYDTLVSMSFQYATYSSYSFCYAGFSVSAMSSSGSWSVVWTGKTFGKSTYMPFVNVSMSFPADTRQTKFSIKTATNTNCRYYTPMTLTNVMMYSRVTCLNTTCSSGIQILPPPTLSPTLAPSQPSAQPSNQPTGQPSSQPTMQPSSIPSNQPTGQPSSQPTMQPSSIPSNQPTGQPSVQPTNQPTGQPSSQPTMQPSSIPSNQPTGQPSRIPTNQPTGHPSSQPTMQPSSIPSNQPTGQPSRIPTNQPSGQPSSQPTMQPSGIPSNQPTGQPSAQPSNQPSSQPSSQPTMQPTSMPSNQPSGQPSLQPSGQPTGQPSGQPSGQPTGQPSVQPTGQPSGQPTSQPSSLPTAKPLAPKLRSRQ